MTRRRIDDRTVAWSRTPTDSGKHRVCVIIPTYNEVYNIESVLDILFMQEPSRPTDVILHALIVDDSSPDGTAFAVREYQRRNEHVHLLVRADREGLGRAYIAGMRYALDHLDPDIVFEMDADLSHDPSDIFRMIAEIRRGADCVIGSRYVAGGSIPEDWGLHRRFTSGAANLASRLILGMWDVKDCSGGFRAIRADALRDVPLEKLDVKGYAFQVVLLERILRDGGIVREVPIHFSDREFGESKMRVQDVLEGFAVLARIRIERFTQREEAAA